MTLFNQRVSTAFEKGGGRVGFLARLVLKKDVAVLDKFNIGSKG
jgi:hypothetical protein